MSKNDKVIISVLCPTRGRTALMKRALESCFSTCANPAQIEFVFGLDDDDLESIKMAQELEDLYPDKNISHTIWPRKKFKFSDLMNQCSKAACGEIFGLFSDDAIYNSKNWDDIVVKFFNECEHRDKLYLLQTSGGANPQTGFPFMHKNWRTAAGYLLAPIFNGDWGDYWLADVINGIGRERFVFCRDIEIKHLHVEWGKMEKDQTYFEHLKERKEQENLPRNLHPYHGDEGQRLKALEIENLRNFIKNFKEEE